MNEYACISNPIIYYQHCVDSTVILLLWKLSQEEKKMEWKDVVECDAMGCTKTKKNCVETHVFLVENEGNALENT